jgi:hypothetical protein
LVILGKFLDHPANQVAGFTFGLIEAVDQVDQNLVLLVKRRNADTVGVLSLESIHGSRTSCFFIFGHTLPLVVKIHQFNDYHHVYSLNT